MKTSGCNAASRKEKFWSRPKFWAFHVQKAPLVVKALEHIKSAGLVDPFVRRSQLDRSQLVCRSTVKFLETKVGLRGDDESFHVGFADSVITESFVLFGYCVTLCLMVLLVEMILSRVQSELQTVYVCS